MQLVMSHRLWPAITARAAKARRRQAAIAYVTEDLLGLRAGDLLVTDASRAAIRSGETCAMLLRTLLRRGVKVHSCAGLHAKAILLDEVAVIGSGNMSRASRSSLIEAAILTDAPSTVSGVASLIAQLVRQSPALDADTVAKLCAIKVIRRVGPTNSSKHQRRAKVVPLGHNAWLVGVHEVGADLDRGEQRLVDSTRAELARRHGRRENSIEWIRWDGGGRFLKAGKPGDQIIQIYSRGSRSRSIRVIKAVPVLDRRRTARTTFVFVAEPTGRRPEMSLARFNRLLKTLGVGRPVGATTERLLEPSLADGISSGWKSA